MAQITDPLKFNQVKVGEIRVSLIGPDRRTLARYAFVDTEGVTYGDGVWTTWSPRSMRLFSALCQSIEDDVVKAITVGAEEPDDDFDPTASNAFLEDSDDFEEESDESGMRLG